MNCNFNEKDIKNLNEIKEFLDVNDIKYSTEKSNFCLWYNNPDNRRTYEIEYVSSSQFPISYPKYNIKGVESNYFYKLSYEAENANSFKLWIKDYEWDNETKKEILKSYILHAADKTPYKFYGRDCEIKIVETKEAREFESNNCFYGKRGASLNLGLYLKNDKNGLQKGTLLMIYTFGKNFFGKNDGVIEIIRVGTKKYCYVIGGASKLLNHFLNNYKTIKIGENEINVKQLKFYSDYDHNLGSSLEKMGFELKNYSKGGFLNYWVDSGTVKHREPMKHKWVMEQMSLGKCYAIPNAGTKNFVMDIK